MADLRRGVSGNGTTMVRRGGPGAVIAGWRARRVRRWKIPRGLAGVAAISDLQRTRVGEDGPVGFERRHGCQYYYYGTAWVLQNARKLLNL